MRLRPTLWVLSLAAAAAGLAQTPTPQTPTQAAAQTPAQTDSPLAARVLQAIRRSTLDQVGTAAFHLKATVAPTLPGEDRQAGTGTIEIWWQSPAHWRREIHSAAFSQVQIVDGDRLWQRTHGDYFPAWLREPAVELVQPVPDEAEVLDHLPHAQVTDVQGVTHATWEVYTGPDHQRVATLASVSVDDATGLLYGGFNKFLDFHGLQVPSVLALGEYTTTVGTLEDLGTVSPSLFDANAPGADALPLRVETVDGAELMRRRVVTPLAWPAQATGPLRGQVSALLEVDRLGVVRRVDQVTSDNPGLTEAAAAVFRRMRFAPLRQNGAAIQAIARVELPFSTTRPNGTEEFDPAHVYLDKARAVSFPSNGGQPYLLRAAFQLPDPSGTPSLGRYEDTYQDPTHWRREAWVHTSHIVRSQDGTHRYAESDGPDAPVLYMVLHVMEPLPAPGAIEDSVWRIRRDTVEDAPTIRVAYGPEDADGGLDLGQSQGFWIDANNRLVRSVSGGVDVLRTDFTAFDGAQVAQTSIVRVKGGGVALRIQVRSLTLLTSRPPEWTFFIKSAEVRHGAGTDLR